MATDSYWSGNAYTSSIGMIQFERMGHPGRYTSTILTEGAGQTDFTGSNYGAAAFIIGTAAATIHTVQGGAIKATDLTVGTLYPISPHRITGGSSAYIYILKQNG